MPTTNPARIDYDRVLAASPSQDHIGLQEFLTGELPYVWLDEYIAMSPHPHNGTASRWTASNTSGT
jgi:hypothetical protein